MRRVIALLSLSSLLLALLPGVAAAAPATRFREDAVVISCEASTADGFVAMFAGVSSLYGAFGYLDFWPTGSEPYQDDPSVVAMSADVSGDATAMTATFELAEYLPMEEPPFGDPAGQAILTAALTPDGDPETIDDRYRYGNAWEVVSGTSQPLLAEGALVLPGADLTDLSTCYAADQDIRYFATNPSAYNDRFREFTVQCSWETTEGFVGLSVFANAFDAYGDVYVSTPTSDTGGSGEATLTESELALAVSLEDWSDGGGGVVGSAEASATLASTGTTVRTVDRFGRERVKVTAELYTIQGDLDVTIGSTTTTYPIDDEHCYAADQRVFLHAVWPNGPKPGPLANDTPDGAEALRLGRTARVLTGANAFEPEATCTGDDGEGGTFEYPIAFTAWWTVTGTGDELIGDTAGSDFDTILGVYTMGSGGLEQVGCVDDVVDPDFSLQARVTWASEAGETYYLQAGGYGGSAGRLEITVR